MLIRGGYIIFLLICTATSAFCTEGQKKEQISIKLGQDQEQKNNIKISDYGIHGHLFEIEEVSLLEEIMSKLHDAEDKGIIQQLQKEFSERVKAKVLRPTDVADIRKAVIDRSWSYSPIYTQETDIVNHDGKIIIKAGTTINALNKLSWGEPLIFIDGDDDEQVKWAAKQKSGKIVLVRGAPLELQEKINRPVYFDQGGILCRRFNIEAVPAIVEQEQKHLKISEIKI